MKEKIETILLIIFRLIFFNIFLILFSLFFWLRWVLVVADRILAEACGIFRCGAWAPRRGVRASLVVVRGPERVGSVVAAHRLSCPVACGILVP